MKHVLVLNQFALPRSQSGGTRHIDLFGRVEDWSLRIIAGNRNYTTQQKYTRDDRRFTLLPVPAHSRNGLLRMFGWGAYAVESVAVGLTGSKPDVVYASTPHLLTPVAGAVIARLRRAPLIVEVRDLWPESIVSAGALRRGSRVHKALAGLERFIYHAADHIVAVTPGWEQHFAALGVAPDKVTVIPNGSEQTDFVVSENRDELRSEFNLTGPTAVYAGAHGPANALDFVIQAARELGDLTVLLIGDGTEKDRLRRESADLSNVRFLDPLPKRELARLFAAADFGIHCIEPLPVLSTGMSPNKLFDYMAAGLPVVSNAGDGLSSVIADGECGHTGDPHSLTTSLKLVMGSDRLTRQRWSERGRALVTKRFSRESAAHSLRDLLDDIRTRPMHSVESRGVDA